jgi:hypothetical protein
VTVSPSPEAGTAEALEALAVRCEERAAVFDTVAAGWGPKDRDQALGDAGIAAGFRGAAEFAREALTALDKT